MFAHIQCCIGTALFILEYIQPFAATSNSNPNLSFKQEVMM